MYYNMVSISIKYYFYYLEDTEKFDFGGAAKIKMAIIIKRI